MIENATLKNLKPIFSGHETFPLRYGWLKKIFDFCQKIQYENKSIIKDLFGNTDYSTTVLGVGKNMVSSMKYWSIYTGLLQYDENKNLILSDFAKDFFSNNGLDPWMENYATLWYIHWKLITNQSLFLYYYIFNKWNFQTFDKDLLIKTIKNEARDLNMQIPNEVTLKKDIECFLGLYASKMVKDHINEDSIISPLVELGLIGSVFRRDLFQLKRGPKANLSIFTFVFILLMFWKNYAPNSRTISIESITYEPLSPGRVCVIDEETIGEFLQNLSDVTNGLIEWSETAGLKQIILNKEINFEKVAYEIFKRNYHE